MRLLSPLSDSFHFHSCDFPVFYSQAWYGGHHGDVIIAPHGGTGYQEMKEPLADGNTNGVSLKFHKGEGLLKGILQFEYAREYDGKKVPGMYWDLSHVDGDRPGVPGRSPFADVDVMAIPLGTGQRYGTCDEVYCSAGEVCEGSYQYDKDDKKTKVSPWTDVPKCGIVTNVATCSIALLSWSLSRLSSASWIR